MKTIKKSTKKARKGFIEATKIAKALTDVRAGSSERYSQHTETLEED